MLKQITNTDKKYVSVPVTDLKLDAAPKVNSFNGITSDAVARAIAGASGEVPQVTENDNGKVLTAVYDEGGPAVEWAEAQGGLPEITESDNGKVLKAQYDDGTTTAYWGEAGGGGATYTAGDGISISSNTINVAYNTQDFSIDNPMLVSNSIPDVNDARYLQFVDEGDTVQPYFNRDGGEISITASAAQAGCTIRFGLTTNPEFAFDILGFSTMPVVDSFGDPVLLAEGTNSFTDLHTDYEETFETLFPDVAWYDVEGMCLVAVDGNGDIVGDPLTLPTGIQFSTTTTKISKKLLLNRPVPVYNIGTDNGKVLTVTGSGMAWQAASGGSGGVQLIPVPALTAAIATTLYAVIEIAIDHDKLPVLVTANATNSNDKRYWPLTHIENIADPSYGFNAYRFTVVEQVYNSGSSPMLYDLYQEDIIVGHDNGTDTYNASAHRYQVATAVAQASFDPFTA